MTQKTKQSRISFFFTVVKKKLCRNIGVYGIRCHWTLVVTSNIYLDRDPIQLIRLAAHRHEPGPGVHMAAITSQFSWWVFDYAKILWSHFNTYPHQRSFPWWIGLFHSLIRRISYCEIITVASFLIHTAQQLNVCSIIEFWMSNTIANIFRGFFP